MTLPTSKQMEITQYSNQISELTMTSANRVVAKELLTRCLLIILLEGIQASEEAITYKSFNVRS